MSYTKGKWEVFEGVAAPAVIIKGEPNRPNRIVTICRLERGSEDYSEALANAHLTAAAPEMYVALIMAQEILRKEGYQDEQPILTDISRALAKAEGVKL
ncbi:MAG: hypothetical protein KKD44_26200 [Proteobacteria bacterium]|nr:hypothetical protein [Pseudomonadota bacterium]